MTDDSAVTESLSAPVVLKPALEDRVVKSGQVIISGTVSQSTAKVSVTHDNGGEPDTYFLSKYTVGSTEWNYVASESFGNLVPGENIYSIKAKGFDLRATRRHSEYRPQTVIFMRIVIMTVAVNTALIQIALIQL